MPRPIPFHDFGGNGPLIHLAHANGYPPAVYRQMVKPLLRHHRVIGMHQRPLWPAEPYESFTSWHILGHDLVDFLESNNLRGIIGVGHSLGGVATMYAALERPELFRALVLIEPVFLPPALLDGVGGLDEDALAERVPLIAATRGRRNHWPDRQTAFDHFRSKPIFERMSDVALWDYVDGALMKVEGEPGATESSATIDDGDAGAADAGQAPSGGLTLVCPREWEVRIYSTPPTDVWDRVGQLTQPTLGVIGAETDTIRPEAWALWQEKQPDAQFAVVPGAGHLLTFERHRAVGRLVRDYAARVDTIERV